MLAGYLCPHTFNCLIYPPGEFPILLFVEGSEKAQRFDSIERRFTVVICRVELLHKEVDECLISTRISFMKHILLSVRTRTGMRPRRPTSKNDIHTGNVSVLILLPKVVFNKGMAQSQSSFWLCIGQCFAPTSLERLVGHRTQISYHSKDLPGIQPPPFVCFGQDSESTPRSGSGEGQTTRPQVAELIFEGNISVGILGVKVNIPIDLIEATLSEETTSECVSELKCVDKFLQNEESPAASLTATIAS